MSIYCTSISACFWVRWMRFGPMAARPWRRSRQIPLLLLRHQRRRHRPRPLSLRQKRITLRAQVPNGNLPMASNEGSGTDGSSTARGLVRLVLTLVKLLHDVLERQAVRRMEAGRLTEVPVEDVGTALFSKRRKSFACSGNSAFPKRICPSASAFPMECYERCRNAVRPNHVAFG